MIIRLHSGSAYTFLPPGLSRFRSHIPFYHITCTHTHRRIIKMQHVDLYDAYMLLFLTETLLSRGSGILCYASICQGLLHTHNTAIKSEHLHGNSAPQTYSIICISSESCLGSTVGIARPPCFGALCSVISAKVAQGELL